MVMLEKEYTDTHPPLPPQQQKSLQILQQLGARLILLKSITFSRFLSPVLSPASGFKWRISYLESNQPPVCVYSASFAQLLLKRVASITTSSYSFTWYNFLLLLLPNIIQLFSSLPLKHVLRKKHSGKPRPGMMLGWHPPLASPSCHHSVPHTRAACTLQQEPRWLQCISWCLKSVL